MSIKSFSLCHYKFIYGGYELKSISIKKSSKSFKIYNFNFNQSWKFFRKKGKILFMCINSKYSKQIHLKQLLYEILKGYKRFSKTKFVES